MREATVMAETQSVRIRRGRPDDGADIMRVHRRSILLLGRSHYTVAETESWAAGLDPEHYGNVMTRGDEIFDVAVDEDDLVVAFCSRCGSEISALYVDPDWAGHGVGSLLLRRAEAGIALEGHKTLMVKASRNGRPFYEKHGYRVVGVEQWKTRGGLEVDRVEMRKSVT